MRSLRSEPEKSGVETRQVVVDARVALDRVVRRANMAHAVPTRPDSGLGFQVKVLKLFISGLKSLNFQAKVLRPLIALRPEADLRSSVLRHAR